MSDIAAAIRAGEAARRRAIALYPDIYETEGTDANLYRALSLLLDAAQEAEAALAEERRRREEAFAAANLTGLPVHFVSLLPRGHIFMHPDTPKSGVRDPFGPFPPTEAPR